MKIIIKVTSYKKKVGVCIPCDVQDDDACRLCHDRPVGHWMGIKEDCNQLV